MTTKQMERPGNATPELDASDVTPEVDSDYPLLTALGLTQSDFAALRTNGFVVCEQRRASPSSPASLPPRWAANRALHRQRRTGRTGENRT